MDKLAKQLREDAESIDVDISTDLDARIRASLVGVDPAKKKWPDRESKSFPFWWASSLTGVAAALAVVVIVNLPSTETPSEVVRQPDIPLLWPDVVWNAETAVLTSPLEQEIENLQSDLKKAEQAVKDEFESIF